MKSPLIFLVSLSLALAALSPVEAQRNRAAQLNNQALTLAQEGKLAEAIALYTQAIAAEENQTIYYNRAYTYLRAGQLPEALKDANRVLQIDPISLDGLRLRTRVCLALEQPDKALVDATELLRLQPDNPDYADARADVLFLLKRYSEALDAQFYALYLLTSQKQLSAPEGKEIQAALAIHYFVLGLPAFGKTQVAGVKPEDAGKGKGLEALFGTAPAQWNSQFAPSAGELRFEGIVAAHNLKTGALQVDVLAVSFPDGKNKVLPAPKRRAVAAKSLKFRNARDLEGGKDVPKAGDFVVLTGKDTGKLITPRVAALALRTLPDEKKLLEDLKKLEGQSNEAAAKRDLTDSQVD